MDWTQPTNCAQIEDNKKKKKKKNQRKKNQKKSGNETQVIWPSPLILSGSPQYAIRPSIVSRYPELCECQQVSGPSFCPDEEGQGFWCPHPIRGFSATHLPPSFSSMSFLAQLLLVCTRLLFLHLFLRGALY